MTGMEEEGEDEEEEGGRGGAGECVLRTGMGSETRYKTF